MSRTKQMNVSIPLDKVPVLADFDYMCKAYDVSRSEQIMTLMIDWLSQLEGSDAEHELCEHSANELMLPEFLR